MRYRLVGIGTLIAREIYFLSINTLIELLARILVFNNKMDPQTGLPKGRFEMKDYQDKQYFYTKMGQMIFLAPTSLLQRTAKSQKHKLPLSDIPKNKQGPSTLVEIILPIAEAEEKSVAAAAALATAPAAQTISPATGREKKRIPRKSFGAFKSQTHWKFHYSRPLNT
jgi:hypothetical protein